MKIVFFSLISSMDSQYVLMPFCRFVVRFIWLEVFKGEYVVRSNEVTGEWRKLHNEELSDLYSLPNIVRVVKSRKMR